jgi:hypothetical protein
VRGDYNVIAVRLEGGLGNQMFQYAAARALALRHKTEVLVDVAALLKPRGNVTRRVFELGHFKPAATLMSHSESRRLSWLHRVPRMAHWVSRWHMFAEQGTAYQPAFASLPDQSYLLGYWQSYRYFSDVAALVAAELEPLGVLSSESQAVADRITATPSVAVHVRRGDYVTLPSAANFHGVLPLGYYAQAMERVLLAEPQAHFFVFSDDLSWCQEHLSGALPMTFVGHNAGPDAWQDLTLMCHCRHHVIANSSFSWWGAWLADQRWGVIGRQVIAPKRWFAGQQQVSPDRYPEHWVAL